MLWNLDPVWLVMAISMVAILTFMFGLAVDALMADDAFGPVGNMLVMTGGFFTAVIAANYQGLVFHSLGHAVGAGLLGAFAAISLLALAKAGLARL